MALKTWDGTQWVDTATAHQHDTYLQLIGGSMTGDIILAGDPTLPLHPATKQYVDGLQDGLHTISTTAPAGPSIGDVWVNPDAVDENAYLPLLGGIMTGDINMDGNSILNVGAETPVTVIDDATSTVHYTISSGIVTLAVYTKQSSNGNITTLPAEIRPASGDLIMILGLWNASGVGQDETGLVRVRASGALHLSNAPTMAVDENLRGTVSYVLGSAGV